MCFRKSLKHLIFWNGRSIILPGGQFYYIDSKIIFELGTAISQTDS
jgi:hypothetical protein